jgi:hypothetical protein
MIFDMFWNMLEYHKVPRLPRDLHIVTTGRSLDDAIRQRHATPHVYAAPVTHNDDGGLQSAAQRKVQLIFWKRRQSTAPAI